MHKYFNIILLFFIFAISESFAQFGNPIIAPSSMRDDLNNRTIEPNPRNARRSVQSSNEAFNRTSDGSYPNTNFDDLNEDYGEENVFQLPVDPITHNALVGQRVVDALFFRLNPNSPVLLSDIRNIKILDEEKINYKKEGNLFINTLPESNNEYISGETFSTLRLNISILKVVKEMSPLDFYGKKIMSTDRFSVLPNYREKMREKNKLIYKKEGNDYSGWSKTFLKDYRIYPNDPLKSSQFFKLFVPPPPDIPMIPPPPGNWRPPIYEKSPLVAAVDRYMLTLSVDPLDLDGSIRRQIEANVWQRLNDAEYKTQFLIQYGKQENNINNNIYRNYSEKMQENYR